MAKMPNYYKVHTDGHEVALKPIYEELVPVVHGKAIEIPSFIEHEDTLIKMDRCCNKCTALMTKRDNYCPNCGAKMDGTE